MRNRKSSKCNFAQTTKLTAWKCFYIYIIIHYYRHENHNYEQFYVTPWPKYERKKNLTLRNEFVKPIGRTSNRMTAIPYIRRHRFFFLFFSSFWLFVSISCSLIFFGNANNKWKIQFITAWMAQMAHKSQQTAHQHQFFIIIIIVFFSFCVCSTFAFNRPARHGALCSNRLIGLNWFLTCELVWLFAHHSSMALDRAESYSPNWKLKACQCCIHRFDRLEFESHPAQPPSLIGFVDVVIAQNYYWVMSCAYIYIFEW